MKIKLPSTITLKIIGMKIKELYEASPFGMVGAILCGVCHSAMFALIAVYAAAMNFSIFEISFVTFLVAISGAISQWPIGKLSDIYDRRKVIIAVTLLSAFFYKQTLNWQTICGLFLIVIGVTLVNVYRGQY